MDLASELTTLLEFLSSRLLEAMQYEHLQLPPPAHCMLSKGFMFTACARPMEYGIYLILPGIDY